MDEKLNILIIEDDKYILNFISLSLKTSGYNFITASKGIDGLSLVYGNKPDVILLDLGLPDIDGIVIIKKIREVKLSTSPKKFNSLSKNLMLHPLSIYYPLKLY